MKGAAFVQQIVTQYPNIRRPAPSPQMPALRQNNHQHNNSLNATHGGDVVTAVQHAMSSLGYVTAAKEMGIADDVIRQILTRFVFD